MIKITNDTSTLTGSLTEMKDNLITELANKGVTATYNPVTGLQGLIHKISEIPTGGGTSTVATLELITNKNILSYYDSETATLTITAKDSNNQPVVNETIYIYRNNIAIGTATTNNNGIAGYTYNSTGIGDITITTATNSILSNNITIEDCYYYNTTEYTSEVTLNINLPNNPFICTFDMNKQSNGYPSLNFGETTSSNYIVIGVGHGDGRCAFQYFVNGSRTELLSTSNSVSSNTYYNMSYSYNNGTHTYNAVNNTLTSTKTGVTMSKLISVDCFNGKVKNIKIKPLTTQ